MTKAAVHSVETFGSVDGPGIRFIIFLKGCKLRCRYCHNPDTWNPDSKDMRSADELLEQALKYRTYWGKKGGITVSGGEALLQMDFMIGTISHVSVKIITECEANGNIPIVNLVTCLDTC